MSMPQSMPEQPLVPSWFAYGLFKRLKKDLPATEYEEFVKWWNSRLSTGDRGSAPSKGSSNE